jgi:hypothetical protein
MPALAAQQLFDARREAIESGSAVLVESYSTAAAGAEDNEFCMFLKPELAGLPVSDLDATLDVIRGCLDRYSVTLNGLVALPGAVLDSSGAIRAHYGVINKVAREGYASLAESAVARLREVAGEDIEESSVYGAFQFLDAFPFFTPAALGVLYDNLNSNRLAGGTHGAVVEIAGARKVILNGFHPAQIEHFTSREAAIVAFSCTSASPWTEIRQDLTGATNPADAKPGSIRYELLSRHRELGIAEFGPGLNGVHVSAGPVEGMIEIARYFAIAQELSVAGTAFGRLLTDRYGAAPEQLPALADNPTIESDGRQVSVFDATEELDAADAAALVGSRLAPSGVGAG